MKNFMIAVAMAFVLGLTGVAFATDEGEVPAPPTDPVPAPAPSGPAFQ